jgi:hypothetical protein
MDSRCVLVLAALVLLVPGCKKFNTSTNNSNTSQQSGNNNNSNLAPPAPGGVVQNVRNAVVRTFTLNEMKQLALWYQFYVTSNNTPPNLDALSQDREMGSLYKAVKDGDLVVIWPQQATTGAVLLAYPKNAAELQSIPLAFCDGTARNVTKVEFDMLFKGGK